MKIVIIGGVAGGASAAARLRRLDEQAEIVVFERTGYMSYANCGLPYYIGGVIRDEADLTLQTPESFYARFRIDVRVRQEVTSIERRGEDGLCPSARRAVRRTPSTTISSFCLPARVPVEAAAARCRQRPCLYTAHGGGHAASPRAGDVRRKRLGRDRGRRLHRCRAGGKFS